MGTSQWRPRRWRAKGAEGAEAGVPPAQDGRSGAREADGGAYGASGAVRGADGGPGASGGTAPAPGGTAPAPDAAPGAAGPEPAGPESAGPEPADPAPTGPRPGTPPAAAPRASRWPEGAGDLLADLLGGFRGLADPGPRADLLDRMDRAAEPDAVPGPSFRLDVPQDAATPRAGLRAVVAAVETHPDPDAALRALRTALRGLARPEPARSGTAPSGTVQNGAAQNGAAPGDPARSDPALPWLELAVLGLTGAAPLSAAACLRLIGALRGLVPAPAPAQLARHIPYGVPGTALLGGGQTLPEIVLRLSDRRGAPDPGPLLRFLTALAADRELTAYARLAPLRGLLADLGAAAPGSPGAGRLIVQIRVDAVDPEHVADRRYELRGAYYRQPLDGGPLRWLGALAPSEPFRRGELTGRGSARMTAWAEPAREIRSGGGVRIEFLLPQDLLGHRADLWSAGPSRTPLGRQHPVVVRSLERYTSPWLDPTPWRRRWSSLDEDVPPPDPEPGQDRDPDDGRAPTAAPGTAGDPLERIAWPMLDPQDAAGFTEWLIGQPELACLGLCVPYDRLAAKLREAVLDALFVEGVPVMVWRGDPGDPGELVGALRRHAPERLRDLPETVHHCRRHGRTAGESHVSNSITLLWDDPTCVDADQDLPYAGMA